MFNVYTVIRYTVIMLTFTFTLKLT